MSESEEPDRPAELAMPSEAMWREIERAHQFFREHETVIRQAQRFFRENEQLMRQVQQVVQAAEWFGRVGAWPVPPFQQRLVRAVGAAVRELTPPRPVAHQRTASLTVTPVMTATGGQKPKLGPRQVKLARQMYDETGDTASGATQWRGSRPSSGLQGRPSTGP